jgi:hypothetical protein
MFETALAFLKPYLSQFGPAALIIVAVVMIFKDRLPASVTDWLAKLNPWSANEVEIVDQLPERVQVLEALDACYDYFHTINCPEGCEAIKAAVLHVYHEHKPADPRQPGPTVVDSPHTY